MGDRPCFDLAFCSQPEDVYESESTQCESSVRSFGDLELGEEMTGDAGQDDSALNSSMCVIEFDDR